MSSTDQTITNPNLKPEGGSIVFSSPKQTRDWAPILHYNSLGYSYHSYDYPPFSPFLEKLVFFTSSLFTRCPLTHILHPTMIAYWYLYDIAVF